MNERQSYKNATGGEDLIYNEIKLNITKAINEIPQITYKNLLIGSCKGWCIYKKNIKKIK